MALAVDSEMASNAGFGLATTSSPQTFSFTNTAGTLLVAIIGVGVPGADTASISNVTYNGVALTQLVDRTTSGGAQGGRIGLFYLLSPATGSNTLSFAFTFTGINTSVWGGCISFTGNDSVTPFVQNTASNGSSATASVSLSGVAASSICVAGAGAGSDMTGQSQTLSWAKNVDGGSAMGNGRSSRSASSGSVTHNFTISGSDLWATLIAEVAAGATPPTATTAWLTA